MITGCLFDIVRKDIPYGLCPGDQAGAGAVAQLTAEPLKIDVVVIKKARDLVINKNIAVIFREYNLLEYKNPTKHVSIKDFYKVYAYTA
jgi:hypothetical protein